MHKFFISSTQIVFVSTCFILLYTEPIWALSCIQRQEIKFLIPLLSKGPNVVEAIVDRVVVDDKAKTIKFDVSTTEVFNGEALQSYSLIGASKSVAGAPMITKCDAGMGIHQRLDAIEYDRQNRAGQNFKSPNALAGFPKHNCKHYKKLKGKRVVFFGFGKNVWCLDGIVEIEDLIQPEIFRSYLRCVATKIGYEPRIPIGTILKSDFEKTSQMLIADISKCSNPFSE